MISKFNASIQPQRMFAESIAAEQDRMMRQTQEVGEQAYQNRKRMQEAMERTAHNTDVTNERLEKMIDQQSSHIELLEKANEILQNIFASGEDGVLVEKELMNLIKKEIDETHPLWEYVKDKGGDIAVAGATAGIPVLYGAFKAYLLSKGIMLP